MAGLFLFYIFCGIAEDMHISAYDKLYARLIFIVFCFNIYAAMVKLKDINNKELVKGIYRYFLILNVVFVIIKALEFYVNLIILMHA